MSTEDGTRVLGAYRLLRELGRGGMGAVYLAVRDDDVYRTEVAVKVLERGLASAQAVARFRDERQMLATLQHPGIVALLDGGSGADGLPYLVMEYVRGLSITGHVTREHVSIRRRVELLRDVCAAVQYAHQRLIVHRDIKPQNILVSEAGDIKLLDFGIARLLDDTPGLREAHTRTGARILTPEYASPEQLRGETVDTASDIYSLGLVLYELLTGVSPQRAEGRDALAQAVHAIEHDPARPSEVAPASDRRALRGDLDTIVMKALRKEPSERYPTAAALADDLRRYLTGLPIEATATTWRYRAGKFVRRHRAAVVATALATLTLGAAIVTSLGQAARADAQAERAERQTAIARERLTDVRRLTSALLFDVDDALRELPGATAARELLVSRAIEYLAVLARDAGADPSVAFELATAYMRIGEIQRR